VELGRQREARLGTIADVANAIRIASAEDVKAWGRAVFFVGAGCSVSSGIPLVPDMARSLVQRLARKARAPENITGDSEAAYRWLAAKKQIRDCFIENPVESEAGDNRAIDWFRVYDTVFSDHFNTPDDAREVFSEFVDDAGGRINWTHLCLGELVRQRLASTVITTNFDQLVLSGLVRSGVIPVVCDGIESLTRIRGAPKHAQLIELHGSRHTYRLRNATEEVAELASDEPTIAAIGSIFQDMRALVVIGYGGREDGIMDLMTKAARRFPDKRLIWVAHDKDPRRLSEKAKSFLATSRNSRLLVGQDSDSFFLQLLKELEIGSPETVREPLFLASVNSKTLSSHDSQGIVEKVAIQQEIERHRSEIRAMTKALHQYRENRSRVEDALVRSREMGLAGKLDDALKALTEVPEAMRGDEFWEAIGTTAAELGVLNHSTQTLNIAAEAWSRLVDAQHAATRIKAKFNLANTMRSLGEISGHIEPLSKAKEIFEDLLREPGLSEVEIENTDLQMAYGTVMGILGGRESSGKNLEQAISVFHEILKQVTRKDAPLDWALAQMSLGNALVSLGERENETETLEEAVAAYREALKEYIRERLPGDWARTQMNLGNALTALGEREKGTNKLEEAIIAYREALKERAREHAPQQWAVTQMNLGVALATTGERESGVVKLKEAVVAFREALKELTHERSPMRWAAVQVNLGSTLGTLGEREDDKAYLEEAITSFRDALEVYTRERAPLDWAKTQVNLGLALSKLGALESDRSKVEEAVTAYREALKELTAEAAPFQHKIAKQSLKIGIDVLKRKEKSSPTATP
jgi:tetratricopeptide (TPR) repeat protein